MIESITKLTDPIDDSRITNNIVYNENVKETFTYNSFNQIDRIKIGNDSKYFTTKTSYGQYSQYVDTTTDEFGNTVDYNYDVVTGLLKELFDEKGNKTSYTYYDLGRLHDVIKLVKEPDNSIKEYKNTYIYDSKGRLDKIYVNNYLYDFEYDDYDRLTDVKVGDITLMQYTYLKEKDYFNNTIDYESDKIYEQIYGNQDRIKFDYDDEDRLTAIKFKKYGVTYTGDNVDTDGYLIKYQYEYDNSGNPAKVIDNIINKSYYYNYDFAGRITKIVDEVGNELIYSYDDEKGELIGFKYNINDISNEVNYKTDENTGLYIATDYYLNDGIHVSRTNHYNTNNNNDPAVQTYRQLHYINTLIGNKSYDTYFGYDNPNTTDSNTSTRINDIEIWYGEIFLKDLNYEYDERGNITSIVEYSETDHENYYSYEYDALNQLTKETLNLCDYSNGSKNVIIDYEYDNYGNITKKTENINGHIKIYDYKYNSTVGWNDQLTGIEIEDNDNPLGEYYSVSYDNSGNPTIYKNFTFEYEGRQLVKVTNNSTNDVIKYKYNDQGYRTQKIVHNGTNDVTTNYYLSGDKVVYEQIGNDVIYYTYDANGKIISFNYNGNEYFYIRNLQGDIVGIHDKDINVLVKYSYGAYGNILNINDSSGFNLGQINIDIVDIDMMKKQTFII